MPGYSSTAAVSRMALNQEKALTFVNEMNLVWSRKVISVAG